MYHVETQTPDFLKTMYRYFRVYIIYVDNKMQQEVHVSGGKVFTFASGISLLLFYAFAMQCMSTLAIVKRETNSWKWPLIQLFGMSAIAYIAALIAFQILN